MATIKEQDIVLVSKEPDGTKVIQMPITRVENVEGGIATVNGIKPDSSKNISISKVSNATKAFQDGNGKIITDTYATKTELSTKLDSSKAFTKATADTLYLGKKDKAVSASSADSATKATQDGTGNVIATTYATNTQLTQGLAGKAPSTHTHTKSQITDFPAIPDTSTLIPKTGARGEIAGYETVKVLSGATTINGASQDNLLAQAGTPITVQTGASQESWTKVIRFIANPQLTLGGGWNWVGGSAPTIEPSHVVVLHWDGIGGYASLLKGK